MVTTIAKRIQSKLSRQGIKVSLCEIRPVYNDIVVDADNPTAEEVETIFQHVLDQASKLAPVDTETAGITELVTPDEELAPIAPGHDQSDNLETVHSLSTDVNTTPQAEETETSVCAGGEIGNIATPAQMEPETLEEVGAIAPRQTSDLVSTTAESMGITLNIEDVTAIAENFDYASTNSDDELEEIKSAITAFVQHKAQITQQKITNIVEEVKQTIHNLDAENSQHLNDGLRSISQDIKSGSERFRQQTRQALKVFALPPIKAG